jgi:hypothetical protein
MRLLWLLLLLLLLLLWRWLLLLIVSKHAVQQCTLFLCQLRAR